MCLARVTASGGECWNRTSYACGRTASASGEGGECWRRFFRVCSSVANRRPYSPCFKSSEDAIWLLCLCQIQMPDPLGYDYERSRRDSNPRDACETVVSGTPEVRPFCPKSRPASRASRCGASGWCRTNVSGVSSPRFHRVSFRGLFDAADRSRRSDRLREQAEVGAGDRSRTGCLRIHSPALDHMSFTRQKMVVMLVVVCRGLHDPEDEGCPKSERESRSSRRSRVGRGTGDRTQRFLNPNQASHPATPPRE